MHGTETPGIPDPDPQIPDPDGTDTDIPEVPPQGPAQGGDGSDEASNR